MRTHIDWLTFTITPEYFDGESMGLTWAVYGALDTQFGAALALRVFGADWERRERSRAPYSHAWSIGDVGITIFASENLNHACVEISGQGCEYLIERELLNELLTKCHDRVTRIDIACDIETNTIPTEFVFFTNHERMRASGYQKSESGETCYVGSQKSDRYARVYRYYPPHPRHNLLRIEHVFRRSYAKSVAIACVLNREEDVSAAAGVAFGWGHSDWQPSNTQAVNLTPTKIERKMGKTVFWLIKSCAPAFKRLCEDGTIRDPQQFFNAYFLPGGGEKSGQK